MNVILTTKRYQYVRVFVDHFSRYSYMHLHQTVSSEEIVEGKYSFEKMAAAQVIIIKQ